MSAAHPSLPRRVVTQRSFVRLKVVTPPGNPTAAAPRSQCGRRKCADIFANAKRARPEFFAARFAKIAKNVDGVLVDHLAQFKKRLGWLQINIDDLLTDLLGAGEDFRRRLMPRNTVRNKRHKRYCCNDLFGNGVDLLIAPVRLT